MWECPSPPPSSCPKYPDPVLGRHQPPYRVCPPSISISSVIVTAPVRRTPPLPPLQDFSRLVVTAIPLCAALSFIRFLSRPNHRVRCPGLLRREFLTCASLLLIRTLAIFTLRPSSGPALIESVLTPGSSVFSLLPCRSLRRERNTRIEARIPLTTQG